MKWWNIAPRYYFISIAVAILIWLGWLAIRACRRRNRTPEGKLKRRKTALMYTLLVAVFVIILGLGWLALIFSKAVVTGFASLNLADVFPEAIALCAIGLLTMATLQSVRLILPIRGWFHARKLEEWLSSHEPAPVTDPGSYPPLENNTSSQTDAISDLMRMIGSSSRTSLLDLPIDQLCGQIGAAAEAALAKPRDHSRLLFAIIGNNNEDLLRLIYMDSQEIPEDIKRDELDQLRNPISYKIQRSIDNLQISTASAWKRLLRITAIYVSGVLGVIATMAHSRLTLADITHPEKWPQVLVAFIISGLVAGFLASVFRDLAAVIEKLRQ